MRISAFLWLCFSVILAGIGFLINCDILIAIALIILTISVFCEFVKDPLKNILFLAFVFTFFYFTAITPIAISLKVVDYHFSIAYVNNYINVILRVLYVSLISCYVSYLFFNRCNCSIAISGRKIQLSSNDINHEKTIHIILPLFIISAAAKLFVSVYKVLYAMTVAYSSYHADIQYELNSLPSLLLKIGSFYTILFCMCLATFIDWKYIRWIFLCDFCISGILILTGSRTEFAKSVVIMIIYLCYYHEIVGKNKAVFIRKLTRNLMILIPVFMILATIYQYIRAGLEVHQSIGQLLVEGIIGNESAQMIAHVEKLKETLPHTGLYSLGDVRLWINNSFIGRIFGVPLLHAHTAMMATSGIALGQTVAYYVMPDSYLLGAAFGSSFVAELYADGGYLGVLIGSVVYGFILRYVRGISMESYTSRVIGLLICIALIYSPRAGFSSVFTEVFSFSNIFMSVVVFLLLRKNKSIRK